MTRPEPAIDTELAAATLDGTLPVQILLDIAFDVDSLYAIRAAISAHGSSLPVSDEILHNVLIVASEQATNAIRHGSGSGHLRLWRDQDVLYCQVSDHGPGITDATIGLHAPDPEQSGGRGLWLIRQLADTLDITSTITGATTTAAFHLSHQN